MRIQTLSLDHIKGLTANLELAGRHVWITGPNMAGKTAIIDGLELALTGAHGVGKTGPALRRLISGKFGSAEVTTTDGQKFTTSIRAGKSTTVEHSEAFPVSRVALRPSDWLNLGPKDQTAAVRAAMGDSMSAVEALEIVGERQKTGLAETVLRAFNERACAEALGDAPTASEVLARLRAIQTSANAIALQMEKTTAGDLPRLVSGDEQKQAMAKHSTARDACEAAQRDAIKTAGEWGAWENWCKAAARQPSEPIRPEVEEQRETLCQMMQLETSHYREQESLEARRMADGLALRHTLDMIEEKNECPLCGASTPHWKQRARELTEANAAAAETGQAAARNAKLEAQARIAELTAELAKLPTPAPAPPDPGPPPPPPARTMEDAQEALKAASAVLEQARNKLAELAQLAQARRDILEKSDKAAAYRGAAQLAKETGEEVAKTQTEKAEKQIARLLTRANHITEGILPGPLEWVDNELCYRSADGAAIHCSTWSGTEALVGAFAWVTALQPEDSPLRLAIFDEFQRLTLDVQAALIARLNDLAQLGAIDQVFIVSHQPCPAEFQFCEVQVSESGNIYTQPKLALDA